MFADFASMGTLLTLNLIFAGAALVIGIALALGFSVLPPKARGIQISPRVTTTSFSGLRKEP